MPEGISIYRHRLATRVLHWVNALCVFIVLMSGLQIFDAHPRLYWGAAGADADPAALEIGSREGRGGQPVGVLRVGRFEAATTGFLGISRDEEGELAERAFPAWATLPSERDLATGRRWHFFFAWVLVLNSAIFLIVSLSSGHIRRDLLPTRSEVAPAHVLRDIGNHLRLRFPRGESARNYNVLQKLAYLSVIFVLAPLLLGTGLTMSPGMDAALPWLVHLYGGRQSARTLHFLAAMLIVLFIGVHLTMVVLAGPWNELRSMITGRYVLPAAKPPKAGKSP
jgi:thiosulfate reductase cytochrome b subunit